MPQTVRSLNAPTRTGGEVTRPQWGRACDGPKYERWPPAPGRDQMSIPARDDRPTVVAAGCPGEVEDSEDVVSARRKIAIEFDAPLRESRHLARAIAELVAMVDPASSVYTGGFRPVDWPPIEKLRIIVEE